MGEYLDENFKLEYDQQYLDCIRHSLPDIHLQWFAAEDEGRTFDPTERKIQKAKEEGRVAKTAEIPSALILITVTSLIWVIGKYFLANFFALFNTYFGRLHLQNTQGFSRESLTFVLALFKVSWPVLILTFSIGILGNVLQFGWAFSVKPITPDFSKVGFKVSKWLEKIFSIQGWYNTGISILKLALVAVIVFINVYLNMDNITAVVSYPASHGLLLGINMVFIVLLESGFVLLVIGMIDYQFQRYLFLEQLKMTHQDIKEEFKESEGDPEVKQRVKSLMQDFMSRNIVQNVSESDVLITNPTHFAIALQYDRETMQVPKVTAKGEDNMALRMRKIATEAEVPIIENKPLARAMYAELEVGDEIPEHFYQAVVIVFQEVYKIKGVFTDA